MKVSVAALVTVVGLSTDPASAFVLPQQQHQRVARRSNNIVSSRKATPIKEVGTVDVDLSDPLRPVVNGETMLIPFSENEVDLGNGLVNDGPFSWLAPYLSVGGYEPGKKLVGGIATKISPDTEEYEFKDEVFSQEEQERRTLAATEQVVNISPEERYRRREVSNAAYLATIIYAFVSANFFINDFTPAIADHLWRLAIFIPLSTGYGLQLSADRGLWNVAQRGLWDVTGQLEPIPDPTLARALIDKVNKLNGESLFLPLALSLVWSVIPIETASSISSVGQFLVFLYLIKDKIPKEV